MINHLRLPMVWAFALSLSACGEDGPTSPATTVDQAFEPGTATSVAGIDAGGAWAQTFTVGTPGTLHSVDLILNAQDVGDVVRIDIRGTTGGSPNLDDATVLDSVRVTASSLPAYPTTGFVTIDFSGQGIPVTAGQVLAIVVIRVVGAGGADVLWITENEIAEEYVGGTKFQRIGGSGTAWTALGSDFYFRTRLLDP